MRLPHLSLPARPTLFIALGGSGLEVMLRVRRRILSAGWGSDGLQRVNHLSEFPPAQFLHIDLDVHQTTGRGVCKESDPLAELEHLPDEDRLCELDRLECCNQKPAVHKTWSQVFASLCERCAVEI